MVALVREGLMQDQVRELPVTAVQAEVVRVAQVLEEIDAKVKAAMVVPAHLLAPVQRHLPVAVAHLLR